MVDPIRLLTDLADLLEETEEAMVLRSVMRSAIRRAISAITGDAGVNVVTASPLFGIGHMEIGLDFIVGATAPLDYFADDGCANPWYSASTYPCAFYDSTGQKTYFTWEAWSGSDPRLVKIRAYDHATARWTQPFICGNDTLTNDGHGVPAACIDSTGRVHVFYGTHDSAGGGDIKHSSMAEPGAIDSFIARTPVGPSLELAYPHPIVIGSDIYMFARERETASTRPVGVFKTTGLTNGVATWSSIQYVVDYGASTRTYLGNTFVVDDKIYLVMVRSDQDNTWRRDKFLYVYDPVTGDVSNIQGTHTVDSLDLPINLATSETHFQVYDSGTTSVGVGAACVDGSGVVHVAFPMGTDIIYTNYTTAWSTTETITSNLQTQNEDIALIPLPNGELELYYAIDPDTDFSDVRGGDMYKRVRSAAGTWGTPELILAATAFPLAHVSQVYQPNAKATVCFAERTASEGIESGELKCYAYGSDGFVKASVPYVTGDTDAKQWIETVEANDDFGMPFGMRNAVIDFVKGCKTGGIWESITAAYLFFGTYKLGSTWEAIKGTDIVNGGILSSGYDRLTGQTSTGAGSYYDPGVNNNALPQNSRHIAFYQRAGSILSAHGTPAVAGGSFVFQPNSSSDYSVRMSQDTSSRPALRGWAADGTAIVQRTSATNVEWNFAGTTGSDTVASTTPADSPLWIFRGAGIGSAGLEVSFWSCGQSLNMTAYKTLIDNLVSQVESSIYT